MQKSFNPWFYFSLTFIFLIIIGTFLLHFHTNLSLIDSIFTSTSAVCVTGLIVTDTAKLDIYTQLIILSLIQLGGLGVMVLTSSILLYIKGFLDLRTKILLQKVGDYFSLYDIEKILKIVILPVYGSDIVLNTIPQKGPSGFGSRNISLLFFLSKACKLAFSRGEGITEII